MPGVKLTKVEKSFGTAKVIHGVSMEIDRGEFAVFVGPSGCGKSTLLRMIAGLEETTAGRIEIEDRDVTQEEPARRGVAMVFQSYALYPHLTVFENMAFSLRLARAAAAGGREAKVGEAARILRLEDHLQKKPSQLSGGQRQRVAIGRAIVRQPKVFLFDEPLSNLDAELRVQMRLELARLHQQIGATMIYVTHDQVEAMTLADKIFVLQCGRRPPGRAAARPLRRPRQPLRRRLHRLAQHELPGRQGRRRRPRPASRSQPEGADGHADRGAGCASARPTGTRVTLGMRPEHLEIAGRRRRRPAARGRHGGGPRRRLLPARPHRRRPADRARAPRRPARTSRAARSPSRIPPDRALVFDEAGERLR